MKLLKLADRGISVLGLLLFGVLTGISLFTTVYFATTYEEIPYQKADCFVVVLLFGACFVLAMELVTGWILKKEQGQEKRLRIFLGAVLLYTLAFGIYWVFAAKCIPLGDQASVCAAAEGFRKGDYSLLTQDSYERYLYIYPHQLGLTALIELIFLLFGNGNYLAFELLNCLGAALCVYSGYRIVKLLTERRRAWIYYLCLAACCFPLLFYTVFVYGEIPSIMLCLLSVWLFLEYWKKERTWYFLGSTLFVCLAVLIRSNSMIVVVAMLCILAVTALGRRKLRPLLLALVLVVSMTGSRKVLNTYYENRADLTLNDGAPMILWVAMGLQDTAGAPGWSNGYILHAYWGECDFDGEAAAAMGKADIKNSFSRFRAEPAYAGAFFLEKFTSQWNDSTCECFAMTHVNGEARGPIANSMYDGKLHALMTWFMNQYQSLIFGGVFLWLLFGFWRKKDLETQILLITIFGGFLFSMMWEAKGRYILPYFVMMVPMAASGLEELAERGKSWLSGQKQGGRSEGM